MKTQTLNKKSTRRAIRICALPFAALLAVSASAADLTWSIGSGNWNTTDANFGGLWIDGNTAVFGGSASSTIDISPAGRSATGVKFNVGGDNITGSGGSLTLTGTPVITVNDGLSAQISAVLAGSAGFALESNSVSGAVGSGGTLTTTGVETITAGGFKVGAASSGNTWNLNGGGTVANGTGIRQIFVGNVDHASGLATTGNNRVVISTPGNSGAPSFNVSGNGGRVTVGYASSGNSLKVDSGAYIAQTAGGGTNTWELGVLANANSNSLTVTGTGSSVVFGSNQYINAGVAGDSNSVTISAGGTFSGRRIGIGTNGGDTNSFTVTGAGSTASITASTNAIFEMGVTAGSNGNFMSIAAGGVFNFTSTSAARQFSIGRLGDSNYMEVTGASSAVNVTHLQPVAVGGSVISAVVVDGGTGNHLDINNGGAFTTNSSLYVLGSTSTGNSTINLGDGTGTGTLTVGATATFTAGILLNNANGRLKINSGVLIAGATGALVSGAGQINLTGPAKFTINSGTNTITSVPITGIGSLNKDGVGTLTISGTTPSYTGDTTISAGTLNITAGAGGFLDNDHNVTIVGSSVFGLNWSGADTIKELFIGGSSVAAGTWGSTASGATNIDDTHFTGTGSLNVTGVPEPGTAVSLLGGLGMLLGLRRRRK